MLPHFHSAGKAQAKARQAAWRKAHPSHFSRSAAKAKLDELAAKRRAGVPSRAVGGHPAFSSSRDMQAKVAKPASASQRVQEANQAQQTALAAFLHDAKEAHAYRVMRQIKTKEGRFKAAQERARLTKLFLDRRNALASMPNKNKAKQHQFQGNPKVDHQRQQRAAADSRHSQMGMAQKAAILAGAGGVMYYLVRRRR